MNARVIPRTAVAGYIKLVRLPLDGAVALLPGDGIGLRAAAGLALDRADATARAVASVLLGDPVLGEDAARRRAAADERGRALGLRTRAERTRQRADARLDEQHERSQRKREDARTRADDRRRGAERAREVKKQRAAGTETKRRGTARRAAARRADAVEARARDARLDALETTSDALREQERALGASDEARRLERAAGRAKAARKGS